MSAIASIDLSGVTSQPLGQTAGQTFGGLHGEQPGSIGVLGSSAQQSVSVKKEQPIKEPEPDQVQLSKQAEARLMRSQGQSLAEIEATLGLGESTVTSYLGITVGGETLISLATAAVESRAAQSAAA